MEEAVRHILDGTNSPHVLVGPLVTHPMEVGKGFIVCASEAGRGFRCDRIGVDDPTLRDDFIGSLALLGAASGKGLVVHSFDDELDMVLLAQELWPCEQLSGIRADMEAERGIRH